MSDNLPRESSERVGHTRTESVRRGLGCEKEGEMITGDFMKEFTLERSEFGQGRAQYNVELNLIHFAAQEIQSFLLIILLQEKSN